MSPRIQRAIRLSPEGIAAVQELADQDQRTWSDMARILLTEAIAARKAKKR